MNNSTTKKKARMSLDEFLNLAEENPSVLYNEHQMMYFAISRYGKDSDGHWAFTKQLKDDGRDWRYILKDDSITKSDSAQLYGVDDIADAFVDAVKAGIIIGDERNKVNLFVGPAGTGKNAFIRLLDETERSFVDSDDGTQYIAKINLGDLSSNKAAKKVFQGMQGGEELFKKFNEAIREKFGSLTKLKPTLDMTIGNSLNELIYKNGDESENRLTKTVENINGKVDDPLKKIYLRVDQESSTAGEIRGIFADALNGVMQRDSGVDDDMLNRLLESVVTIERASKNDIIPISKPKIATGEKNFDYKGVFGGEMLYPVANALKADNTSSLSYDYGVAGSQMRPAPIGRIILLNELLKSPESFVKQSLDFTEDMQTGFKSSYVESMDSLFLATTNFDDYANIENTLKTYLSRRFNQFVFKSIHKLKDARNALDNIVSKYETVYGYHHSKHFNDVLARVWVELSLENAEGITLAQKADIYDGKEIETEKTPTKIDLVRMADAKPIMNRMEGIKYALTYNSMQTAPRKLYFYARQLNKDNKEKVCLDSIFDLEKDETRFLEDILNTMEDVSAETRSRLQSEIGKTIIADAFDEYRKEVGRDVIKAIYGMGAVGEIVNKYILNVYFMNKKTNKFEYNNKIENVDEEYVNKLEEKAEGLNKESLRNNVTNTLGDYLKSGKSMDDQLIDKIGLRLLDTYPSFQEGVLEYLKEHTKPMTKLDSTREVITKKLEEMGYCERCAQVAYTLSNSGNKKG